MFKRTVAVLVLCVLLCGCGGGAEYAGSGEDYFSTSVLCGETKLQNLVFFSYIDIAKLLAGKTERSYYERCCAALDNISVSLRATVAVFQARPFSDALYFSDVYPLSRYVPRENSAALFDPLAVFIEAARERGIAVWAWVNPYRIGTVGS